MLDMDINTDALGVLSQSKAVDELKNSVGYAVGDKLNDIQANKLLSNMQKMDNFYNPPAAPENITDLRTGVRNLDREGLASLRLMADDFGYVAPEDAAKLKELKNIDPNSEIAASLRLEKKGKKLADSMSDAEIELRSNFPKASDKDIKDAVRLGITNLDDLPPPGSRGGPEDIAAPFTGAGLEAIKNVKNNNLIVDDIVDTIYLNAGVSKNAQPTARANAREFLNRVKDLEDPEFPSGTTLSSVMEADDFKFMTEGGGGGMGDPMLLVQKYFGPKVASAVAQLKSADDIQLFAERLIKVKDAKGKSVTNRFFDPESVDPNDFEFADGGRVPYMAGMLVRGGKMGYQALRKYGIEGKDISRLFASLGTDKSLVGKEKTAYFQQLHKVLRNPDAFPDEIMDIQKQLGIDVGLGFRNGGLAGILEV